MMQRTKRPIVALFVEENEDGTVGGSHVCLRNLVMHLDPQVVRPIVLVYQETRFADELRQFGIETHVWREARQKEHLPRHARFRRLRAIGKVLGGIRRRVRFIKEHGIDVVHLNNGPSHSLDTWWPSTRLTGRPCVAHIRGHIPRLRRPLLEALQKRFDFYIPMSNTLREAMERAGFPRDRTKVVFDAIDEAAMLSGIRRKPHDVRRELGVEEGQFLAVMAGHVRRWKGQGAVLRSLALLGEADRKQIVVAFAGGVSPLEEAYAAELRTFVATHNLGEYVKFLGERADVPELMNAADFVIHASIVPEPFGLVVLEGMILGKVVFAADRGGPTEIITSDSGVLFNPDVPEQLARELSRAIHSRYDRRAVGEAARARARAFGPVARTAREIETLLQTPPLRDKVRRSSA